MERAWYKSEQTGFRMVEVMGRVASDQARVREVGGREHTCSVSALYTYDEASCHLVEVMQELAEVREAVGQHVHTLAMSMPAYRWDDASSTPT